MTLFSKHIRVALWGVLLSTSAVSASNSKVTPPVDVTGPARYPSGIEALRLGTFPLVAPIIENTPYNPMVVANKKHKDNLLVVCSQGGNLNYLTDLTVFSTDKGRSWNQSDLITGRAQGATLPGAPNDFVSPADPFCASDKNGNLYFDFAAIQLANADGSFNPGNALNFTKSKDSGNSWIALNSIVNNLSNSPDSYVDRPTITADPYRNHVLYAVWGNTVQIFDPTLPQTLELQISHDGGNTWSSPRTIKTLDVGVYGFNAILHILPDKSAIIIYQSDNPDGTFNIIALKSKDFVNWKEYFAYKNGILVYPADPDDPNLDYATYALGTDSKVNQKTGELYITWGDAKANPKSTPELPASGVFVSKSADGGKSWSKPIVANPTTVGVQTFSPTVAVTKNGNVGICFYDFREYHDEGDFNANLKTNLWLAVFDHKLKYRLDEIRLTPHSFDARKYTFFPGEGFEISDFGTIDAVDNDFLIAYPITNPPFGGGPIVVSPGEIFTGLPVTVKFVRASLGSCEDKIRVKPFPICSTLTPGNQSSEMVETRLSKLKYGNYK